MKILVTDGDTRAGLAIVRSLGKAGHEIFVGARQIRSLAGASRYAAHRVVYPDPFRYVAEFSEYLSNLVKYYNIDTLLPVTDITTLSICRHRGFFPEHCSMPFPDLETVLTVADKDAVTDLARKLDVDIPLSITLSTPADIDRINLDFKFPVVIKPSRSRISTNNEWLYTSISYAHDHAELVRMLKSFDSRIFPVLLQEKIVGPGMGLSLYMHHGETKAAFAHRRIREKPPSGGVSVVRESIPIDPIAYTFADKLLSTLNWHGVAMVEFKLDVRDQRPKLMEINGRFWGSLQLAIDAGVDFPRIIIDSLQSPPNDPLLEYTAGCRTRWLWGDIDALLLRVFRKDSELDLPPGAPGRREQLIAFLKDFGNSTRQEIERFEDIGPAWFETRQWLGRMLGMVD